MATLVLSVALVGCAGQTKRIRSELDASRAEIERLEKARAADSARMAVLSSSLLVLKDQVETLIVGSRAAGRAELPVIRLGPSARALGDGPGVAAGAGIPAGIADDDFGAMVDAGMSAAPPPTAPGPGPRDPREPVGVVAAPGGVIDYSGSRPLLTDHPSRTGKPRPGSKPPAASLPPVPTVAPSDRLPVVPLGKSAIPPEELYRRSLELVRRRDYGPALRGFNEFIKKYPTHIHADNSLYWMGEIYYDRAEYLLAISEFARVVREYPTGNKAPAALLKMGFAYQRSGDLATARSLLKQVVRIFPGTDEARLAAKKLEEWK